MTLLFTRFFIAAYVALVLLASGCRRSEQNAAPANAAVPRALAVKGTLADSIDFIVAGLPPEMDTTAVRDRLGSPDSTRTVDNPLDSGALIVTWFYRPVTVEFMFEGKLSGITLLDATRATHRGLRVGDSTARVHQLYGPSSAFPDGTLEYGWAPVYQRVIRITVRNGRVAEIFVGFLLD